MSLFCGILLLDRSARIDVERIKYLRENISRSGVGSISEYSDENLYLAKLDFGAFGSPGWRGEVGLGVTAVCGDSLLYGREPSMSRISDVDSIYSEPASLLAAKFKSARGTFSAASYRAQEKSLVLATDKLGVRPVYFMSDSGCLFFSGALRLLEGLPGVKLSVDLRGAMEAASFGFPMADRTHYSQIRLLRSGQMLACGLDNDVTVSNYWRWDVDACSMVVEDTQAALADLHSVFAQAVRLRVGSTKSVFAGLTGGLDSRCVVTELRSQGLNVHSLNVSWQKSADQVLGAMYSQAIGTRHHEALLPSAATGSLVPIIAREAMKTYSDLITNEGGNPLQLWAGDGGSVGAGHVYIKPAAVKSMREGGPKAGARSYLADNSLALTAKPFQGQHAEFAKNLTMASVTAELERLNCKDPARALYVFLLENDQRRHLAAHFEDIDRRLFEFIEPFYDADVLAAICKLPMDFCIQHQMYGRWLDLFPVQIKQVAWQHYPGHEACPIPMPEGVSYQWDPAATKDVDVRQRHECLDALRYALSKRSSVRGVFRPEILMLLYVAVSARFSNAYYMGFQVDNIARRLVRCNGRFELQ